MMTFYKDRPPPRPQKPPISVDEWLATLPRYESHQPDWNERWTDAPAGVFKREGAA